MQIKKLDHVDVILASPDGVELRFGSPMSQGGKVDAIQIESGVKFDSDLDQIGVKLGSQCFLQPNEIASVGGVRWGGRMNNFVDGRNEMEWWR